jgi:hypothetical protein
MQKQKLIIKLYRDLLSYINERYGGTKHFLISLVSIRVILLIFSKALLYLAENRNNHALVNIDETINETINEKKLPKSQRLKKIIKKIRGGASITEIANFIQNNKEILTWVIQFFVVMTPTDLSVSLYDFYHRSPIIKNKPEDVCDDIGSPFGYLLMLFGRGKKKLPDLDAAAQRDEIYSELFNNDKLKPSNKNHRFIVFFLLCSVSFMVMLRDIPEGATTISAFFKALLKAIKNGKISKPLARSLVNRLKRQNIHVPQEIENAINEAVTA